MYLTKDEEKILDGEKGEVYRKALQTIVKVGEVLGADRLIDIAHAHVSGVSYYNIGEAGYKFIEHLYLKGAKTSVFSTFNPVGMDLDLSFIADIDSFFAERQRKIVEMLLKMGFQESLTCTPYLIRPPVKGEHLAWSESSAVGMANTYYGAYTNREAGPLALFSSLVGKTYYAGLHIPDERTPTIRVSLSVERLFAVDESVASAVGYLIGQIVKDGIPYIQLKYRPSFDAVKAYTAAAGATGSIALSYIEGLTPDYHKFSDYKLEKISIDDKDVQDILCEYDTSYEDIEAIFIGCPHASLEEIIYVYELVKLCEDKKQRPTIIVSTSRWVYTYLDKIGLLEGLKKLDINVIKDTCPIVSPVFRSKFKKIATVSGKAYFYLPRQQSQPTILLPKKKLSEILCGRQ